MVLLHGIIMKGLVATSLGCIIMLYQHLHQSEETFVTYDPIQIHYILPSFKAFPSKDFYIFPSFKILLTDCRGFVCVCMCVCVCVCVCFSLPLFAETSLGHWAHGIEDTDAFDDVKYYDLLILWL